jgi:hypothetical protein
MNNLNTLAASAAPTLPWWRVPMVWLVIGGPAAVVVAAVFTAVIAFAGADPVVTAPQAAEAGSQAELAQAPAVQARNHTAAVRAAR